MTTEIQQTIATLRQRLRDEPRDHITANPVFCVQQLRKIGPIADGYHEDGHEWAEVDSGDYVVATVDELVEMLNEYEVGDDDADDDDGDDDRYTQDDVDALISALREDRVLDDEIKIPGHGTFRRFGHQHVWEFVTAHFTKAAAEHHLKINGHNLKAPRIHVESQFRSFEWCAVRDGIERGDIVAIDRERIQAILDAFDRAKEGLHTESQALALLAQHGAAALEALREIAE